MSTKPDELIESTEVLGRWLSLIEKNTAVGVDTEFYRDDTYFPKLCLVQLRDRRGATCIDPLKINDYQSLITFLSSADNVKILHSARQDVEVLGLRFDIIPWPIFDTQIAATLCGYGDQPSYASLVENLLGVTLDKSATRTRWCKRPLSVRQLDYALADVEHLPALYEILSEKLESLGRGEWMTEEMQHYRDPTIYRIDPGDMWRKIKGGAKLPARNQHCVKSLAAWREIEAQRLDIPRSWVASDRDLLFVAAGIDGSGAIIKDDGLSARGKKRLFRMIETATSAFEQAADSPPIWSNQDRDKEFEKRVDETLGLIRSIARETSLPASFIASRRDVGSWLKGDRSVALARGWRACLTALEQHETSYVSI